jgi:hypothetical protein
MLTPRPAETAAWMTGTLGLVYATCQLCPAASRHGSFDCDKGGVASHPSVTRFSHRNAYLHVRILRKTEMHWKKRQKQIQFLQAKHGNDRSLAREFPDLKVEQRTPPCLNGMRGRTARRALPPGMKQFPIGHCHKQGYELIIPGTDLQWMGGKKP